MPFIYVRNPPRHGKTFCLDALFGADTHVGVLKVEISHNLLNVQETMTPFAAQQHFWTRVAKQLLRQLSDSKVNPPYVMLSEWESIARACPGIDAVPVVICADELSKLLKYQKWKQADGVRSFFSSLARCGTPRSTFLRWERRLLLRCSRRCECARLFRPCAVRAARTHPVLAEHAA
jgi:hypothetical protein